MLIFFFTFYCSCCDFEQWPARTNDGLQQAKQNDWKTNSLNWKRIILASNTDTNKFHNIFDELIPHERKRVIKTFLNETAYKGKTIVNWKALMNRNNWCLDLVHAVLRYAILWAAVWILLICVYLLKDLKTLFIQFMQLVCRLHLNLEIMPVFEMIVMSEKNERSLVSRHSLTKSHLWCRSLQLQLNLITHPIRQLLFYSYLKKLFSVA